MLSIPSKKSEFLPILQILSEYSEKTYDASTTDKILPFFTTLHNHRQAFTSSTSTTPLEFLQSSLELYLAGLETLESRVPIHKTQLNFQWTDSYTSAKQSFSSYTTEKLAVLYSLASVYSQIGAKIDLKSHNAHKIVINAYQIAAGYLHLCKELWKPSKYKDDLYQENFCIWEEVITAQAYYTMFHKIEKNPANSQNIVKLAYAVYRNFESALIRTQRFEGFPRASTDMLRLWTGMFQGVTEFYQALVDKEKVPATGKGFGVIVARMRLAEKILTTVPQAWCLPSTLTDLLKSFVLQITEERSKVEDENFSVYMDSIPESVLNTQLELLTLFQFKIPEKRQFVEQSLVGLIIPVEIQDLHQEFESQMCEEFSVYTQKVQQFVQEFYKAQSLTFEGIPVTLWQQISSQQKLILERQLETLKSIRKSCRTELEQGTERLLKEEAQDEEFKTLYKSKWTRQPSCIANADIKTEIAKTLNIIDQGQYEDDELIRLCLNKEQELLRLRQDKEVLDRLVPRLDFDQESSKNALISKLKDSHKTLDSLLESYKSSIFRKSNFEALKKVYKDGESKEKVFNEIRALFLQSQESINLELQTAHSLLKTFTDTFASLSVENRSAQILNSLSSLLDSKKALGLKIDQRLCHYSSLLDTALKLSNSIDALLSKREFEKQEILGRLSQSSVIPSSNSRPSSSTFAVPKDN